jgi:hypothetical protein
MHDFYIYDDYHEIYLTEDEVETCLEKYLEWNKINNSLPEVTDIEQINDHNIGHVTYHANLV